MCSTTSRCRLGASRSSAPPYLSIVDAKSSGSTKTSRNRFKQESFNALPVMLPEKADDLGWYVTLLDRLDTLRRFGSTQRGCRSRSWLQRHGELITGLPAETLNI